MNGKKKPITQEKKEQIYNKARALERESNITLISTSVAIVSFLLMLYVHNAVTTNYIVAQTLLTAVDIVLVVAAVGCAVFAVWKKENFLWEYVAFSLVMAVGYYFLRNGAAGIPGLVTEVDGNISITPFAVTLSNILSTTNIIYGLWAVNVVYCVLTIVLHSVKYTKIKKGSN